MKKGFKYLGLTILIGFLSFWTLMEYPSFLFKYKYQNENVFIHSDHPIHSSIDEITDEVLVRLKLSSLYDDNRAYNVHVANEEWRWLLLANFHYKVGGFAMGLNGNVFMRPSEISENRIIYPYKELSDAGNRDLIYFITHEIGHILMYDKIGYVKHWLIHPRWLIEGYPDYIAKRSFDFEDNLKQFKNADFRLTVESGLYVRYHLYLAYLMDVQGKSIEEIISDTPDESEIEQDLMHLESKNTGHSLN